MVPTRRSFIAPAALAAALLLVTACGGDDDSSSSTAATPTTSASTTAGSSATTSPSATSAPSASTAPSGSTASSAPEASAGPTTVAAKPSGEPVKIGFINTSGGPYGSPQPGYGKDAAVKYINEVYGGIAGRPVEVENCEVDGSPEKDIACANSFVEQKVVAVVDGGSTAAGSELPILHSAGIPMLSSNAANSEFEHDKDSVNFGSAQAVFALAPLVAFQQQGVKVITWVQADTPAGRSYTEEFVAPAAKKAGLTFNTTYFDATNPNFPVLAATIMASNPDVGGTLALSDSATTELVKALQQAGFAKTIWAGNSVAFIKDLGAKAQGVQMYSGLWSPLAYNYAPERTKQDIDILKSSMAAIDHPDELSQSVIVGFKTFVEIARVSKNVQGDLTSESLMAAIRKIKDAPSFLGDTMTCDGTVWPDSSACANTLFVGEAQADGTVKPVTGELIKADPSGLPSS